MTERTQEPHRWSWEFGVEVLSFEGWTVRGESFHTSTCTEEEFRERLHDSRYLLRNRL